MSKPDADINHILVFTVYDILTQKIDLPQFDNNNSFNMHETVLAATNVLKTCYLRVCAA